MTTCSQFTGLGNQKGIGDLTQCQRWDSQEHLGDIELIYGSETLT